MKIKRILSLAVVLAMVLTVVPMFGITAGAAGERGEISLKELKDIATNDFTAPKTTADNKAVGEVFTGWDRETSNNGNINIINEHQFPILRFIRNEDRKDDGSGSDRTAAAVYKDGYGKGKQYTILSFEYWASQEGSGYYQDQYMNFTLRDANEKPFTRFIIDKGNLQNVAEGNIKLTIGDAIDILWYNNDTSGYTVEYYVNGALSATKTYNENDDIKDAVNGKESDAKTPASVDGFSAISCFQGKWNRKNAAFGFKNLVISSGDFPTEGEATTYKVTYKDSTSQKVVKTKERTVLNNAVPEPIFEQEYAFFENEVYDLPSKSKSDFTNFESIEVDVNPVKHYSSFPDLSSAEIKDSGNIKYKIVSKENIIANGDFNSGFAGWTCSAFTEDTSKYSHAYFEIADESDKHGKVFKDKGAATSSDGNDGSASASSLSTAWPVEPGKYYYFAYEQKANSQHNGGIKFLGADKADNVIDLFPDDALLGEVRLGNDGGSFGDGVDTDGDYILKTTEDWSKKEYIVRVPDDAHYLGFREGWYSDLYLDNFELYQIEPDDIAAQLKGSTVADVQAETKTNAVPVLPTKVDISLPGEAGTAKYYVDWTQDDLKPENFASTGEVDVSGKVRGTEISVTANVTVKDPKDYLVAHYEFEDARFNTGDTVLDSSGNNYNANVMSGNLVKGDDKVQNSKRDAGNLSNGEGRYGNAVNTRNGGIQLPEQVVQKINSGSFTISAFIKTNTRQNQSIFTLGEINSHGNAISFFDSDSNGNGRFHPEFYNDMKPEIIRQGADSDFVHVAVSYDADAGKVTVYVDGETAEATNTTNLYVLNRNISQLKNAYIGLSSWLSDGGSTPKGADWQYNGYIDDFIIYSTALSVDDIKALDINAPTASLGWDESDKQFTLNFTKADEKPGDAVLVGDKSADWGENSTAVVKVGDKTNAIVTAYATAASDVVKSNPVKSSVYELVVKDIVDHIGDYNKGTVGADRIAAANKVISHGGFYYTETGEDKADDVTKQIVKVDVTDETLTAEIKQEYKGFGLGFVIGADSTVYFGSSDTAAVVGENSGTFDKLVITLADGKITDASEVTLEAADGTVVTLDAVNIEFVETLVEELEAAGADADIALTPEL